MHRDIHNIGSTNENTEQGAKRTTELRLGSNSSAVRGALAREQISINRVIMLAGLHQVVVAVLLVLRPINVCHATP
jgi:hypothetical protein